MPAASPVPPLRNVGGRARLTRHPFSRHEKCCALIFACVCLCAVAATVYIAVQRALPQFQFVATPRRLHRANGMSAVSDLPSDWHEGLLDDVSASGNRWEALAGCGADQPRWLGQYLDGREGRQDWLLYEPSAQSGLGEQLGGLASAFLLAVLMERNFAVRFPSLANGELLTDYLSANYVDWQHEFSGEEATAIEDPDQVLTVCDQKKTPGGEQCATFSVGSNFGEYLQRTSSLSTRLQNRRFVRLKDWRMSSARLIELVCNNSYLLLEFQRAGIHLSCQMEWDACAMRALLKPEAELVDKVCSYMVRAYGTTGSVNDNSSAPLGPHVRPLRPGIALHFRSQSPAWSEVGQDDPQQQPASSFASLSANSVLKKDALRRFRQCSQAIATVLDSSGDPVLGDFSFVAEPFLASDSSVSAAEWAGAATDAAAASATKRQPLLDAVSDFVLVSEAAVVLGSYGSWFSGGACALGRLSDRCQLFCTPVALPADATDGRGALLNDCPEIPPQPAEFCTQWAKKMLQGASARTSFLAAPFIRCRI